MTDSTEQLVQRLIELEIQLAHHQRLCEQLNEVVTQHTQQLMRYDRIVDHLELQIKNLREQRKEPFDPGLEKPPHY